MEDDLNNFVNGRQPQWWTYTQLSQPWLDLCLAQLRPSLFSLLSIIWSFQYVMKLAKSINFTCSFINIGTHVCEIIQWEQLLNQKSLHSGWIQFHCQYQLKKKQKQISTFSKMSEMFKGNIEVMFCERGEVGR